MTLRDDIIAAHPSVSLFIASDGQPAMRLRSDEEIADIVLALVAADPVYTRQRAITAAVDSWGDFTAEAIEAAESDEAAIVMASAYGVIRYLRGAGGTDGETEQSTTEEQQ